MTLNVLGSLALFDVCNGKAYAKTVRTKYLESYHLQVDQTTCDTLLNVSIGGSADSTRARGGTYIEEIIAASMTEKESIDPWN